MFVVASATRARHADGLIGRLRSLLLLLVELALTLEHRRLGRGDLFQLRQALLQLRLLGVEALALCLDLRQLALGRTFGVAQL